MMSCQWLAKQDELFVVKDAEKTCGSSCYRASTYLASRMASFKPDVCIPPLPVKLSTHHGNALFVHDFNGGEQKSRFGD